MVQDKTVLLEQIHTAIKKNSCRSDGEANGSTQDSELLATDNDLNDKSYYSYTRNREILKKLEQRIDALETQNDRLLYFIHFLYKNFPELVRDILSVSADDAGRQAKLESTGRKLPGAKSTPSLTPRELEILHLLVKGLCAKEIASRLFICETTVITHKRNLKEKFNARNTAELISRAFNILLEPGAEGFVQ